MASPRGGDIIQKDDAIAIFEDLVAKTPDDKWQRMAPEIILKCLRASGGDQPTPDPKALFTLIQGGKPDEG